MFSKRKKIDKLLDKLIIKGINITRKAQEKDAIYSSDFNLLDNVHREYVLWKCDIKDLLNKPEIIKKIDIGVFYQHDSVPNLKGGIEYGNIRSEESQELLKNIRIETSKKLEYLRKTRSVLLDKKTERRLAKIIVEIIVAITIAIIIAIILKVLKLQ